MYRNTRPAKAFRTVTYYGGYDELRAKLKAMEVEFTEEDVMNGFWGKKFTIMKPRGKGATEKIRAIDNL